MESVTVTPTEGTAEGSIDAVQSTDSQMTFDPSPIESTEVKQPISETYEIDSNKPKDEVVEERPEWLKSQYKTVEDQAKAYSSIQSKHDKMLAGFTGAPEGDYSFEMSPELQEAGVEFNANDPMNAKFSEFARSKNMSQETYQESMSMMTQFQHEQSEQRSNYINQAINDHTDLQVSEFGESNVDDFKQVLSMAINIPGVSKEGINDILDGASKAEGLKTLIAIIKSRESNQIPTHASQSYDTQESLRLELKSISAMPNGFAKKSAMESWNKRVTAVSNKYSY